jgi:Fe2+ or Zn2+ uptake regulation protein
MIVCNIHRFLQFLVIEVFYWANFCKCFKIIATIYTVIDLFFDEKMKNQIKSGNGKKFTAIWRVSHHNNCIMIRTRI